MDQVTQQNAALVEQMAAAASSLKSQAQELVQVVATFKLAPGLQGSTLPAAKVRSSNPPPTPFKGHERRYDEKPNSTKAATAAKAKSAASFKDLPVVPAKVTPSAGNDDWETF
jgi:hypothetical protein